MDIEIKKVKLNKKQQANIVFVEKDETNNESEVIRISKGIAHDDFTKSIDALAPHYALLTGFVGVSKGLKLEHIVGALNGFNVSGYSIGGDDEDQGIVITGHRILPNGKAVIVNSPFYRFNESEETRYKFMDELILAVEYAREEAKLYIAGKFKKDPQGELAFDGKDNDEEKR